MINISLLQVKNNLLFEQKSYLYLYLIIVYTSVH